MNSILLTTINAQYIHASLGLRYLMANLGELRPQAKLIEFTLEHRPIDIVESLLAHDPKIIGLGVYIWNVTQSTEVVSLLKEIQPDVIVVLGGPEVSYECEEQRIVQLADYVIVGQADRAIAPLCNALLAGERPAEKIIRPDVPKMDDVVLPYHEYTDADISNRLIYVEASRGCPFKCEFCLSSLDKTAWPFQLERFLGELNTLYERGVRHFKFVDRTFNLNIKASKRILDFFLERMTEGLFIHFELIPDHLPDALKESITQFPPGSLQFEIGIQSLNPEVQKNISRKQDDVQTAQNLRWLREHTRAHLHADLIVGLPGETVESFGHGFDRLVKLNPHEIQVGILKRLRGTP
ncbi:MAG: radical SAM protein, partial [Steroidobacter sp.]